MTPVYLPFKNRGLYDERPTNEMWDWLLEHVGSYRPALQHRWEDTAWGMTRHFGQIEIRFRYPEDAMLFKLTWLGS